MNTSRRQLLLALSGAWPLLAGESFWNRKDASTWTTDEIVELTTRSPWARETRVDFKAKGKDAEGERGPDPGPSTFGVNRGQGGRTAGKQLSVIVSWESAIPLFNALHYRLPSQFLGHYVIGVKDLPVLVDPGPERQSPEQLLDWLKNSAKLQAKDRDMVQCGVVASAREGSMLLFGFLKELLPLSAKDREVTFTLDTNQLAIKTRFEPKEMIYRGELAL
jgi:hypothetical protein